MTYESYILSEDKQRWERIYKDTNYNSLEDTPIKNRYGTQDKCIIISNLEPGNYLVHNYYKLNDDSDVVNSNDALQVSMFKDEENNKIYAVTYEIADDSVSQKVISFDGTTKEIIKEQTISVDDALIQDIDDSVTALEVSIADVNQDITDINTALDSHAESIGNINTTLETHQDEIDGLGEDIDLLNNTESTEGSVRNVAKSYVDALDDTLMPVAKSGSASDVSVDSENLQADDVEEALDELSDKIDTAQTSSQITVTRAQTPDGNDAATYIISQGGVEKGKISITKDLVSTSGELVNEDGSGNPGMFIKMTVANGTPFYIPVDELIDIYQGSGDVDAVNSGVEVKVTNGIISASIKTVEGAKIDNLSVSLEKLTQTLQDKIGLIDSAVFNIYEGATNGTISVDNQEVAVHGLKSAAYTETSAYDASGAADTVKSELLGNAQTDTESSKTIEGLVKKTDGIAEDVSDIETELARISTEADEAVRYDTAQNLTANQKTQARSNIGAVSSDEVTGVVKYTAQSLTTAQKTQARSNIGAISENDLDDSNSWKSEGTEGNLLSKDSQGNLTWITTPTLGTVASLDVAESFEDTNAVPTIQILHDSLYWHDLDDSVPIYGVTWDYSNPSTVLTRTGAASDFDNPTPATSNSGTGSSPFDDIYPWSEMKMYNVENGEITASQDDVGFSFGKDTVVKIPEFYYKVNKDTNAQTHSWSICGEPIFGYKKHPGSGKYIGRYHMSGSSSGVYSKTGATPLVNVIRANCRSYGIAKGDGWRMLDIATWSAVQMLYLVEFANWNSQSVLEKGWNTGSIGSVGGTDNAVYHSIKVSNAHNQYRYIEDLFSNVADYVDGFTGSGRVTYVSTDPTKYADSVTGYTNTGVTMPTSGWIMGFACNDNCDWLFIPSNSDSAQGASHSDDHVTDYIMTASGMRLVSVGGAFNDTPSYGLFYYNASNDASATYGGVGSRLIFDPQD